MGEVLLHNLERYMTDVQHCKEAVLQHDRRHCKQVVLQLSMVAVVRCSVVCCKTDYYW